MNTPAEALTTARAELAAHLPILTAAQNEDTRHRTAAASALRYQQALRALGAEPVVPAATDEPPAPAGDRPTVDSIEAARTTIRLAGESVGAIRVATTSVAESKAAKEAADKRLVAASAEARRVVALVAAIRQAPSVVAAQQLALLGDLGPVGLSFPAPTETDLTPEPAILTLEGRPIRLASAGQKLLASLHLSLAVRRAAGMPLVPIFVEDWGRYDGGTTPGPAGDRIVYVVTTPKIDPVTLRPNVLTVTPTPHAPDVARESE